MSKSFWALAVRQLRRVGRGEPGQSISRIIEATGHRYPRTVETYVRRADRFKDHAGHGFL